MAKRTPALPSPEKPAAAPGNGSRAAVHVRKEPQAGLSLAPDAPVEPLDAAAFRTTLAAWYAKHARVLPWRGISNPYATWLSEIMLQQTRVQTVIDRYVVFLRRFPTLAALAEAPEDAVLALWSGLGYYRRARMLHRGAQFVMRELRGHMPRSSVGLRTLPGVGEYTAAAIASIAFGESIAVLDGNVERVLLRLLGRPEDRSAASRAELLAEANRLVPPRPSRSGRGNPPGDHNQAMMELGATLCLPRNPLCLQCPVLRFCRTRGEHTTPARGKLLSRRVACLLATRKRGTRTEVLLERRAAEASLMPGMLELPPLPVDAAGGLEPVLRLRHGITNTSYYVEVFAESAAGAQPAPVAWDDEDAEGPALFRFDAPAESGHREPEPECINEDEVVFVAEPGESYPEPTRAASLQDRLAARPEDLEWRQISQLYGLPLTGLARKVLQRLGLMGIGERPIEGARGNA